MCTVHCTLYRGVECHMLAVLVHFVEYTLTLPCTCAVYTVHITLYTVQCALWTIPWLLPLGMCTVHYTLYTLQFTVYTVHCTLYSPQCSVHCEQYLDSSPWSRGPAGLAGRGPGQWDYTTVDNVNCLRLIGDCKVFNIQCTVQYTVYSAA